MKKIFFIIIVLIVIYCPNCKAKETEKYFKTTISSNEKYINTYEITKIEYDSVSNIELLSTSVNTEYKKLSIQKINNNIVMNLEWKKSPKYKSYDVIALRGENVKFINSSISGIQTYSKNGYENSVNYNINSSNTKIFNNGFGISMNLVDDAYNYKISISAKYNIGETNSIVYGAYQHAQKNVTLLESQKYTLSSNGYGKVIMFDSEIKSYYDQMSGVSIKL